MRAAPSVVVVVAALLTTSAVDARPKKKKTVDLIDISPYKAKLKVLVRADGMVIVTDAAWDSDGHIFVGDKKNVYAQRVSSGGGGGNAYSHRFWSPRVESNAEVGRKETGEYYLSCEDREEALKPMPDGEARDVLDRAAFHQPLWQRQAHILARDDEGTYYFVDRLRDELGGKGFRIFVGNAGAMKELQMKNMVSDSVGEVFATKNGQLRMVTSGGDATWIKGSNRVSLTSVPVEMNLKLVYGDLGVYPAGLGTPCDDMQ